MDDEHDLRNVIERVLNQARQRRAAARESEQRLQIYREEVRGALARAPEPMPAPTPTHAPSASASPAARPEAVAVPAGAPETPAQKRERLQARVNYWRAQGVRDWTARVAREEGVTVVRIRQILSSAKPKEPVGGGKKPRQAATFCSGLMAPSGRTR